MKKIEVVPHVVALYKDRFEEKKTLLNKKANLKILCVFRFCKKLRVRRPGY